MSMTEQHQSCDTFVALPPATANGHVIFGKNSDRPGGEIQEVIYRPAAKYASGDKVQCTYMDIDQAPATHAVVLSKPAWMWGAEMGANDQGVCIGNEAVWTKLNGPDDLKERLLGMDLVRLGLERGSTAKESLDVIISLLEKHGQGGTCREGGEWSYHNSFLIADGTEAWVLETAGLYWVAERVTEGVRNISNQLTITTKFDLSSANLVEHATSLNLYNPGDGEFNFARVFDENSTTPILQNSSRFCNGRRLLTELSAGGNFGVQDMMKILRDEESGINMSDVTRGSQVSVLPAAAAGATTTPCCHWFTATPNPEYSMFKPFIFCPNSSVGMATASPDYGNEDPVRVKPRFQKMVERRHNLFKGHEKLVELVGKDDPKGMMIVENVRELEKNCIADMEEVLKNFDEQSYAKVSQLFEHMCDIEMNFYK